MGFTCAKANHSTQLASSRELQYRAPRFGALPNFSTCFQPQTDADAVARHTVATGAQWFFAPRWSVGGSGQLERIDELGGAHRLMLGAISMRILLQNNRAEFRLPAGVVVTQARHYGSGSVIVSMQGLVGMDLRVPCDTPKLDLSTATFAFPSLGCAFRSTLE